jgi:hypothetical protein
MNLIRCISVKTTILIGTDKESVCWDSFYRPDEMEEAEKYKHLQESIGGKPSKPWGEFKVEIIPLYAEPVLTTPQPEASDREIALEIIRREKDDHGFDVKGLSQLVSTIRADERRKAEAKIAGYRLVIKYALQKDSEDGYAMHPDIAERMTAILGEGPTQ